MAHRVLIPTPLRSYTGQQDAVEVEGRTVGEILSALTARYADLRRHLYADDGKLRHFVNVYVNDDDFRYLEREATSLKAGDVISIVPSVAGGAPVSEAAAAPELTNAEVQRYSRHLILPEVGPDGQRRLKAGRVLCIGAGGLGSPALLYLAAAGVGTIGIVDSDVVESSNLQRQVIHTTDRIGVLKAESAKEAIQSLNPDVQVDVHAFRIDGSNATELLSQYDVVVDGCDNFDTRYVVNDAAVELRKPVVHGSIFRFEGMASTFIPFDGPCYRCLYPEAPPPELAPT